MKKVSVEFNLEIPDNVTHKHLQNDLEYMLETQELGKVTSMQINAIEKAGAKAGRNA